MIDLRSNITNENDKLDRDQMRSLRDSELRVINITIITTDINYSWSQTQICAESISLTQLYQPIQV